MLRASSGKHARLSGFVLPAVIPFPRYAPDAPDARIYFFCGPKIWVFVFQPPEISS